MKHNSDTLFEDLINIQAESKKKSDKLLQELFADDELEDYDVAPDTARSGELQSDLMPAPEKTVWCPECTKDVRRHPDLQEARFVACHCGAEMLDLSDSMNAQEQKHADQLEAAREQIAELETNSVSRLELTRLLGLYRSEQSKAYGGSTMQAAWGRAADMLEAVLKGSA